MNTLLYRPDADAVRDWLTAWWNGQDMGRPALQITLPRHEPWEDIPALPEPPGWVTHYSVSNYDYRINLAARACTHTLYLGESLPAVSPDLGPNCLALYLGCTGVDQPGTVWFEPCIEQPETAHFEFDPANFYWQFTLRLARDQLRIGQGRFLTSFPDLIEGLDTLAAMRGTEALLFDLIEQPEWVHNALGQITDLYFEYYHILYDLIKDERGGSYFWAWAPGRLSKFQCDFSAMISPAMFGEYMLPVLHRMTEQVDYCLYHWDGPGAIPHHDHLLSLPHLNMIQWTPGAGTVSCADRQWWPLYHKTVEAGKKLMIGVEHVEGVRALRKEFGSKLNQFMINIHVETMEQAQALLHI